MNKLKGKTALVTGASRGIGRQIAIGLASKGCNLILHASKEENLVETEQILKAYNIEVYKVGCDLANPKSVEQMLISFDLKYQLLISSTTMQPYHVGLNLSMNLIEN